MRKFGENLAIYNIMTSLVSETRDLKSINLSGYNYLLYSLSGQLEILQGIVIIFCISKQLNK